MEEEYELIKSPLCQAISSNGKTVQVDIYEDGKDGWILEVIDEFNNSTVWDDSFETDESALNEVVQTIKHEGIAVLIDPKNSEKNSESKN